MNDRSETMPIIRYRVTTPASSDKWTCTCGIPCVPTDATLSRLEKIDGCTWLRVDLGAKGEAP